MKQLSQYVLDWVSCQKCQSLCWLFPIYVILCISKPAQLNSLNIPTLLSDIQSSGKFEMKKETRRQPNAKNFDKAEHSHIITDVDIKTRQIFQN